MMRVCLIHLVRLVRLVRLARLVRRVRRARLVRLARLIGRLVVCGWLAVLLTGCALWGVSPEQDQGLFAGVPQQQSDAEPGEPYVVNFEADTEGAGVLALMDEFKACSQLRLLAHDPPDSRVGLERRALADVRKARELLQAHGYYEGTAAYVVDWDTQPTAVTVQVHVGSVFILGQTSVSYPAQKSASGNGAHALPVACSSAVFPPAFAPQTLFELGLEPGQAALAAPVLDAVDQLAPLLRASGYPFARIADTQYEIDREARTLDASVVVDLGCPAQMGGVMLAEKPPRETSQKAPDWPAVERSYLERLTPWEPGIAWDDRQMNRYREILQQTGLFRSVRVEAWNPSDTVGVPDADASEGPASVPVSGETSEPALLPVWVTVTEAPPRTVRGGVKYASDVGFGVQGSWEHRNLWGEGERLRVTTPVSQERQEWAMAFQKPAFGRRDQSLVADAILWNEDSDAYKQTAVYMATGLERRLSAHWWASARVSGETGQLNEGKGQRAYQILGLPLTVRRDTSDDLFNPTCGTRLSLAVTPLTGAYHSTFATIRTRFDASVYYTPFAANPAGGNGTSESGGRSGDKRDPRLVLAARVAAGSMHASDVYRIPASLRFYAGGGSSVRGYKYQSLGEHDRSGDPVGGLSFNEINLEARFKVSNNVGLVPFVDGGMVYDSAFPRLGKDLYWAAGLGLRYYTAIGPVRLDVAVPLREQAGNRSFQLYISIGQAF